MTFFRPLPAGDGDAAAIPFVEQSFMTTIITDRYKTNTQDIREAKQLCLYQIYSALNVIGKASKN